MLPFPLALLLSLFLRYSHYLFHLSCFWYSFVSAPRSCSFAPRSCLRVRRTTNTHKNQILTQIVRYYSCTASTLFFYFIGSPPLCPLNCSQRLLMTPTAASGICMIYLLRKCCTLQRTCAALRYRFALLYKMCNKISAKKLFCIKIPCAASTATGRE